MIVPTSIRVGASVYSVTIDKVAMNQTCRDEDADLLGFSCHRRCIIVLDPDQAPATSRDTILHECLHTIAAHTDLSRTWGDNEEAIVCRLTPALLSLLRDNPDLLAYLMKDI